MTCNHSSFYSHHKPLYKTRLMRCMRGKLANHKVSSQGNSLNSNLSSRDSQVNYPHLRIYSKQSLVILIKPRNAKESISWSARTNRTQWCNHRNWLSLGINTSPTSFRRRIEKPWSKIYHKLCQKWKRVTRIVWRHRWATWRSSRPPSASSSSNEISRKVTTLYTKTNTCFHPDHPSIQMQTANQRKSVLTHKSIRSTKWPKFVKFKLHLELLWCNNWTLRKSNDTKCPVRSSKILMHRNSLRKAYRLKSPQKQLNHKII
jgi:hypothetical protein